MTMSQLSGCGVAHANGFTRLVYIVDPQCGAAFEAYLKPDADTAEEFEAIDANTGNSVFVPPTYCIVNPTIN